MRYLFLLPLAFAFSCHSNYKAFVKNYTFSNTGIPDYANLNYWAAHPWKWDPSDSIPAALRKQKRDSAVDVFFIYPTTYTGTMQGVNADVNDADINAKTDYTTILYQASAFNQHARIFSPRYRQMHLSQFYVSGEVGKPAFDTAYSDVKRAFEFYLAHYNKGRPLIIAAHSQGALMAERLLKEYFDSKPLQQKLVAAYVIGWPLAKNYFTTLPVCSNPSQTGCFCSWRTFREGYVPDYIEKENPVALVTNPLTWKTTNEHADKEQNKGAVLQNFNEVIPGVADAQIHDGVLWINKPKFKGSIFYTAKNYHIADINLFYINLRENVEQRINAFLKK